MSKQEINVGLVRLLYENLTTEQKNELRGIDGTSIDFTINDKVIGIKKSTDTDYTYIDLDQSDIIHDEIDRLIENLTISNLFKFVDELPDDPDESIIYLRTREDTDKGNTSVFALKTDLNNTNTALANLAANTYTKDETNNLLNIIELVDSLPSTGETDRLYFLPYGDDYQVYCFVDGIWVKVNGDSNLADYSTTSEITSLIDEKLAERDYNVVSELPSDGGKENTLYFVKIE